MLDVQRNRSFKHRPEVSFARRFFMVHMVAGVILIALLLFHELFWWFGGALLWYTASLYAMMGFMNEYRWCQWLLALLFAGLTATGLYFTTYVYPGLEPVKAPLVPHTFIPIWVGMGNLVYAVATVMMLFSSTIRKAGESGFTLWDQSQG